MTKTDLEFIADMTGSLAWPVVVLVMVFAFRKPIRELLERIKRIASGEYSMEFGSISTVREQSEEIQKAVDENNSDALDKAVVWNDLRLLLALSGRHVGLPLAVYDSHPAFRGAKQRILQRELAKFENGRFAITKLGLQVVEKQIQSRLRKTE